MINRLPLRVLDYKTPIELLAQFYPHVRTSNGRSPKIFGVLPLFMEFWIKIVFFQKKKIITKLVLN